MQHTIYSPLLLWVILIAFAPRSRAAVAFTPPDDSVDTANELKSIERELGDRNYPAAAKRLDLLLAARGHPLAALGERTLTSVDAWIDHIPADTRPALAAQCAKQYGVTARRALESLRDGGRATRPDEFYALARRYPLTDTAGAALATAADLALRDGDLPAAQTYYQLAQREQFPLGQDRQRRLQFLNATLAAAPAAPADGAKPQVAGPLPFDALWFGNPSMSRRAKFFPAAYDGRILLASWKAVTMMSEDGQVIWSVPNAKAPTAFNPDRTTATGAPGALFAPATLTDIAGNPAIVVVRQPVAPGEAQFALCAHRAADGKQLWSTDTAPARADLTYAGLPAVCGRYVYCVAVARTGVSTANLVLAALDVTTGQSLWQTTLGAVTEEGEIGGADRNFGKKFGRNPPLSLEAFAAVSEPAVAGDVVVVTPNCGSVIAVGRFDGNIRWVSAYRAAADKAAQGGGVDRNGRWILPVEADRALLARYHCTPVVCRDVIVTLSSDAPALSAFDRATGRRLWQGEITDTYALAGASGNIAVVCGPAIVGIDADNAGKLKWKYTPARGIHITGPALVQGHTVLAPTTLGILQLDATDGSEKPAYTVPSFRHLLTTDAGRSAVTESGAAAAFGFSPTAR